MTFFAARGGPINEGRMAINGMTIAAPFNGGGVSTYILDSVNVDEVSWPSPAASARRTSAGR